MDDASHRKHSKTTSADDAPNEERDSAGTVVRSKFLTEAGAPDELGPYQASIHLVEDPVLTDCTFWLGLNRSGVLTPSALLKMDDLGQILKQSATLGITEPGSLLLTNANSEPASYFLFVPKPINSEEGLSPWIDSVISSLKAWTPDPIGLYLADHQLGEDVLSEMIQLLIQDIFRKTARRKIYLYTGSLGLNFLLRMALDAREVLAHANYKIEVYH